METIRLVLVRHAMPVVEPSVPTDEWRLGEEGRAEARSLRPFVDGSAYFVASSEQKAIETLHELAGHTDVAVEPAFREVHRPWLENYRPAARAYVDGADQDGWEPRASVVERFSAAVARHASAAGRRTLVVGTHGLALTVWLDSRLPLPDGPGGFWAQLRFPDLISVDLAAGRLARPDT